MSLGERIIELRKLCGLSQYQLAKKMNVSRQAVSKWENDQTVPDAMRMIQLAEVLETDVEYLTTGRRNFARRPPVILNTTEIVEKVIEKPIVKVVEKIVEVEKPVVEIQYVEKPVLKKIYRTRYKQNPFELLIVGLLCFLAGFLIGILQ